MKVVISKTEKKLILDIGETRHVVTYTADDTKSSDVKIETLEDDLFKLIAPEVSNDALGTLRYDGTQIIADSMAVCPCFDGIVSDLKSIITAIETGQALPERKFPTTKTVPPADEKGEGAAEEKEHGAVEETGNAE